MFRRILKSLKSENFAFAAMEFVLIIVGVFIAFQVEEWKDERNSIKAERLWLEAVREDLDQSTPFIQGRVAYEGQIISGLDEVLRALQTGELAPYKRVAFERGLQLRFVTPTPFQLIGTIQQLNVSGQLNDIRDPQLRRLLIGLVGYAAAYDKNISGIEGNIRAATDHRADFYEVDIDLDTGRPFIASFDLAAMRANPQFKSDIIYVRNLHNLARGANEHFITRVEQVIEAIDKFLAGEEEELLRE